MARLLARRNCALGPGTGDTDLARQRFPLNRFLWENFRVYDPLRRHLVSGDGQFHTGGATAREIVDRLVTEGYILPTSATTFTFGYPEARRYLDAAWLEELAFMAVDHSGADACLFAQEIEWTLKRTEGSNEVDVIARKGNVLSFTSCKITRHLYDPRQPFRERLLQFILEAAYWDSHFADDEGRAVVLVTTDLLDETRGNLERSPILARRAEVVDVDLFGADHSFEELVALFRRHW